MQDKQDSGNDTFHSIMLLIFCAPRRLTQSNVCGQDYIARMRCHNKVPQSIKKRFKDRNVFSSIIIIKLK